MSLSSSLKNKAAFRRAQRQAGDNEVVCGFTDEDGTPRYFTAPKDATSEDLRARAFQARHGRPMNRSEELLDAALNGDLVNAYEAAMANYLDGRDTVSDKLMELLDAPS